MKEFDHIRIPLQEIKSATNSFDHQSRIRFDEFGIVFRGHLIRPHPQGRIAVAIKLYHQKVDLQFSKLIELQSDLRHRNVISLIGFCDEDGEMILVFEFAANGSLEDQLNSTNNILTWEQRLNICIGAGRGLDYLHSDVEPSVIHRDLRTRNILLDENFEAKIAGVDLSTTDPADEMFPSKWHEIVAGVTSGHVDPEYYSTGHLTIESDIYSFGVLLVEVLCGTSALLQSYDPDQLLIEEMVENQIKSNSLRTFSMIARECLRKRRIERPTMNIVVEELEKALEYQVSNSIDAVRQLKDKSLMSQLKHLRIPLEAIKLATNNFDKRNYMNVDGFGRYYSGNLSTHLGKSMDVMVKRWDKSLSQGRVEFSTEISMLDAYKHRNIVSLVGFCDEDGEMIIVYKYPTHGFFSDYIDNKKNDHLTWEERLRICLGVARGMRYLHTGVGRQDFIMHTDIKTFNILLDDNWEPKITNFGLSRLCSTSLQFLVANPHSTVSYCDPEFSDTGICSKSSDVYSFGVVLFEVLCGRFAADPKCPYESQYLMNLVDKCCVGETAIETIIDSNLDARQIDSGSLKTFVEIAYQCSKRRAEERPTFSQIVAELEKASTFQKSKADKSEAEPETLLIFQKNKADESQAESEMVTFQITKGYDSQAEPEKALTFEKCKADDPQAELKKASTFQKKKSGFQTRLKAGLTLLKGKASKLKSAPAEGSFQSPCQKVPLEDIELATNNFEVCIGKDAYGVMYKGELSLSGTLTAVAVKRFKKKGQGVGDYLTEIKLLSIYKHQNLISLLGFCDEGDEKILLYEYAEHGSLDKYLRTSNATMYLGWTRRLEICVGVARGLDYLHNGVGERHRVIHRDIKSANILLDHNWEAKISGFEISRLVVPNEYDSLLTSDVAGTLGYLDPEYYETGILTKKSDVYSFGVVMFEVLCGRLSLINSNDEERSLILLARRSYEDGKLAKIIDPYLRNEIDTNSLNTFSTIAYQCLCPEGIERPSMGLVVKELEEALEFQVSLESRKEEMSFGVMKDKDKSEQLDDTLEPEAETKLMSKTESMMHYQEPGADDLLSSKDSINDYDWILSPPRNPLHRQETEAHRTSISQVEIPSGQPTAQESRKNRGWVVPKRRGKVKVQIMRRILDVVASGITIKKSSKEESRDRGDSSSGTPTIK